MDNFGRFPDVFPKLACGRRERLMSRKPGTAPFEGTTMTHTRDQLFKHATQNAEQRIRVARANQSSEAAKLILATAAWCAKFAFTRRLEVCATAEASRGS